MKYTIVTSTLFVSSALAANPIWGTTANAECTACLDKTFLTCPDDFQLPVYAECMCGGDGGSAFTNCLGTCQAVDSLDIDQAGTITADWYSYCVLFFPSKFCGSAKGVMDDDLWQNSCGPGAKTPGTEAEEEEEKRTQTPTGSGTSATPPAATAPGAGSSEEDSGSAATTTGGVSSRPTSSSAATAASVILPPSIRAILLVGLFELRLQFL